MNSSTGVEHSVALGAEQKPTWCYEGIDLYVALEIDATESTRVHSLSPWASSDAPRLPQVYPHTLVTPPADVVKESSAIIARTLNYGERKQCEISPEDSAARSRVVENPTCTHFGEVWASPGELDILDGEVRRRERRVLVAETRVEQILGQGKQSGGVEARRSVPGVAVRRFIARFVAPLAVQRDEPRRRNNSTSTSSGHRQLRIWNDQPDERSSEDDHEKICDVEGHCRQCKYEFSSRENVVSGCRCLAVYDNIGELQSVSQDDLEEQPTKQTRRDGAFYSCNENRSWSPLVEDYSWAPVDMSRNPDNQLTGCSEGGTDFEEELDQYCPNKPSSFLSEKDGAVGRNLQLQHNGNPSLETLLLPSKFRDIESFDVAEILAACQLVKMSAFECRKNFSEQELSAMKGYDLNNLEFGGESSEGRLSQMVEKMYGSLPDIDVSNNRNSVQPVVGKFYLSPWSDEDRYIPRIARRARGRLRGSQFSTRIDFGKTEFDEESDCEVLQTPPRKRQHKSTQELLLA